MYLNNADEVAVVDSLGYAGITRTYNEGGELTGTNYVDAEGNSIVMGDGYSSVEVKYDEAGRKTEERFVDGQGSPAKSDKEGYAKVTHAYDENGRTRSSPEIITRMEN